MDQKLGGVFIFDTSMDTMKDGKFTYGLMNQIATQVGKGPGPTPPPPTPGQCHSVSPSATDTWCTQNCKHVPTNCPPALCKCNPSALL